jgi:hypothetical protein
MTVRLELDVPEAKMEPLLRVIDKLAGEVKVVRSFSLPDNLTPSPEQQIQMARVEAKIIELKLSGQFTDQNVVRRIISGYQLFLGEIFGRAQVRELCATDLPVLAETFAKIFSVFTEVEPKIGKYKDGVRMFWNGEVLPPHEAEAAIEWYGLLNGEKRKGKDLAIIFGKSERITIRYAKNAGHFIRNNYKEMLQPFLVHQVSSAARLVWEAHQRQ